jgi:hypothetical protein
MRRVLFFFFALSLWGQATVSHITFVNGSHSSVTVRFDVSMPISAARVRYLPTAKGSCKSGLRGAVQNNTMGPTPVTAGISLDVTGLAPATEYEFCPEVSTDGGKTWSHGVGTDWTTLALPPIHPALPIHPATFDTNYPDVTQGICWNTKKPGYCIVVEPTPCNAARLAADISHALQYQHTSGTIIEIPAGQVCSGQLAWDQLAADAIGFNQSKVNANAITLDKPLSSYGLQEGSGLIFDSTFSSDYGGGNISGVVYGYTYFVHVVDANRFQLYWPWTQTTGKLTASSSSIQVDRVAGSGDSPGIAVGAEVVGAGIPPDTTVTAINGSTLRLSHPASTTADHVLLTFGGGQGWPNQMPVPLAPSNKQPRDSSQYEFFVPWPRRLYWIILHSCVPGSTCASSNGTASASTLPLLDSKLPPPGVRINPNWSPNLAILEKPFTSDISPNNIQRILLPFGDCCDGHGHMLTANMRFTGLELTWQPNPELASDPRIHTDLFDTGPGNQNMIFDRVWIHHPPGRQDRIRLLGFFDGKNMAIKDSYIDNLDLWHASYEIPNLSFPNPTNTSAAPARLSNTSFRIPPTKVYYGAPHPATLTSPLTISWSGAPDQSIHQPEIGVYFDMAGKLIIAVPRGINATASSGNIITVGKSGNASCAEGDGVIPADSYGREAAAPLGCAVLTPQGQIRTLIPGTVSQPEDSESCACLLAGIGPGPYQISNNYVSGTGILIHFDDGGGSRFRADYLIQRNTFHVPMSHLDIAYNHYANQAGIRSDGYDYRNRQVLEWKGGQRVWIDGNIFDGEFHQISAGAPIEITPATTYKSVPSGGTTDVDITNNTFQHVPTGLSGITPYDNGPIQPQTGARFRAYNNLFWDMNGILYSTGDWTNAGNSPVNQGTGDFVATGNAQEDLILDHNTVYDPQGKLTQWIGWRTSNYPVEGVQITNNILTYTIGTFGQNLEIQTGCGSNQEGTDCGFTSGGKPDMIFQGNLIIPGWAKSAYPENGPQLSRSEIQSTFPRYVSGNIWLPTPRHSTVPQSLASVGWVNTKFTPGAFDASGNYIGPVPDFHLRPDSPYRSARTTDGKPPGADIDQLETAEGKVKRASAADITSTSAIIAFEAPDAQACPVDYSATDPSLIKDFTRVPDSGGSRERKIQLSGLKSKTTYWYRVDCASEQPAGSFQTN